MSPAVVPTHASVLVVLGGALLAVAAAGSVLGHRRRAAVVRRCRSAPGLDAAAPIGGAGRRGPRVDVLARWRGLEQRVGGCGRRLARRPADPAADHRLGRSALVAAAVAVAGAGPGPAVVVGSAVWAAPLVLRARRRVRRRAALGDEAPEIVDLLRLGVGSGLNVRLAIDAVVRHHDGLVAAELAVVLDRVARGDRLADALDHLGADGGALLPLVDALVATERYGAPLVATLDRVAADARTARRRRREEAARRVPVKLLFPLVFCTLPAFALLTVVPVLLRSLPSLAP